MSMTDDVSTKSLKTDLLTFMELDIIVYDDIEDIYRFKSGAVHNAIYDRCLISKRTPLHRYIAQMYSYVFFQSQGKSESLLPKIAFHYQQAQYFGHATYFYTLAGESSRKAHSSEEVLHNYSEALLCLEKSTESDEAKGFLEELLSNVVDMELLKLSFCLHICMCLRHLGMPFACFEFSNRTFTDSKDMRFPECTTREAMSQDFILKECGRIIMKSTMRRYCCCFVAQDILDQETRRNACLTFYECYAELHLEHLRSPKEQYYAFWG